MPGKYAYICDACHHRAAIHTLQPEHGDLRRDVFRCALCPCMMKQDGSVTGLSKREYELFRASSGEAPDA